MPKYLNNPQYIDGNKVLNAVRNAQMRASVFYASVGSFKDYPVSLFSTETNKYTVLGLTTFNRWIDFGSTGIENALAVKDCIEKYTDYRYVDEYQTFLHKITDRPAPTFNEVYQKKTIEINFSNSPIIRPLPLSNPNTPPLGLRPARDPKGRFISQPKVKSAPKTKVNVYDVSKFSYWKSGEGQTVRNVIVSDNLSDANYVRGYDLEKMDFRSFRRGSIVGNIRIQRQNAEVGANFDRLMNPRSN